MKILVVRLSSLGDCILATSLFSFLAQRHRGVAITFMTDARYSGLFADDPRCTEVIGIQDRMRETPAFARSANWDLIVDLQNNARSRSLLTPARTGAPVGVFDKLHWERFALLFLRVNTYSGKGDVAARYISAAGGDQRAGDLPPARLFFKDEARERALQAFTQQAGGMGRPTIALFPFSAWKNKEWPAQNFINVGRHFLAKGWNAVIMGGPSEAHRAESMKASIGDRCVALAGKLSLYDCGCLLTGLPLALGNDTGLSHLARACGVKTGIIYGPTTRHFGFFAYGRPPFVIFEEPLFCRPCHAHGGNVCLRFTHTCMKKITCERVIGDLEELASAL